MAHKYILLFTLVFLTSCATVVHRKHYHLEVYSNAGKARVQYQDSVHQVPARIKVKRSKDDLHLRLMNDTLTRDYTVKASPSPAFLLNLLWVQASPAAFLVDFTNQKRFHYGKRVYLSIVDSSSIIRPPVSKAFYDFNQQLQAYARKSFPASKRQVNLLIALPHVNSFHMKPPHESTKNNTGFWGFSTGLEYFYRDTRYLAFTGSAVMDIFIPVPAAVDFEGEHESMTSTYLSLTNNYKFRRITLGYGLAYAKNNWSLLVDDYYDPDFPPATPLPEPVSRSSQSIGFTLNGYHQFDRLFFAGIIYRPTLLRVSPKATLTYEHLLSLELSWKIPLKK